MFEFLTIGFAVKAGLGLIGIIFFLSAFFTVDQQTYKVVERFGKFHKISEAGLRIRIPIIDQVSYEKTLRTHELPIDVETPTKDNAFVRMKISVQKKVADPFKAFYALKDPDGQIKSYVMDVARARAKTIRLDDIFAKKDEIAEAVTEHLQEQMTDEYGWAIVNALVIDIDPAADVKAAMNEINAQERLRVAATAKGEADKILIVKAAEAEAASKKLQGQGIADQRKAIIEGLKTSVEDFKKAVKGAKEQDVMTLVVLTQYFDTLKEIGADAKSNVLFVPSDPQGMAGASNQILQALLAGQKVEES